MVPDSKANYSIRVYFISFTCGRRPGICNILISHAFDYDRYINIFQVYQIIREVLIMSVSSSFICCRFEDCLLIEVGALVLSENNELYVEKTDFVNCSSKTQSGGLSKMNGALVIDDEFFDECYGESGNSF